MKTSVNELYFRPKPDGYMEAMLRTVETSAALGAECVVVHAAHCGASQKQDKG